MLLFLVIGMGGLFTFATLNLNYSNARLVNTTIDKYEKVEAANIAASGIELAVSKLNLDSTWTGVNSQQIASGTMTVSVVSTNSKYPGGPDMGLNGMRLVTSTGVIGNQSARIQAVVRLVTAPSAPPFLQYALASGNDLQLQGSIDVRDDNNVAWNSNIHSNKNLITTGNAYNVRGFGTYSDQLQSAKNHFVPNVNPTSLPVNYQIPPITLPVFNPNDYVSIATSITNGDLTIDGATTLGSKSSPSIYYVNGNLNFRGSTVGYGIFIVTGNINFNGNVSVNSQDPAASNLAFYSGGNIEAHGNINLAGQMYAQGNIEAHGNFTLVGSMTARNNLELSGNPTIRYRPANASLTSQFWPAVTLSRPVKVSFYE
jgi:hypothetical protein